MNTYLRKVQYHETDKMGITHHSNYIKWMEEARISFLDRIGYGYAGLEAEGIISPVTAVECRYKSPCTFNDEVCVQVRVESYSGVRLVIGYEMTNTANGQLIAEGRSEHCFTNPEGRPIALKRCHKELDAVLRSYAEQE